LGVTAAVLDFDFAMSIRALSISRMTADH